ncbi:MAG: hypothetical protein H6936_07455 [Burkholderiales bacterium]|nr:hypothetical protein [Nitrosomonas sp.]MCP5274676.1 hypothetical protein [Burkholderiales bacterium]
MDNQETQIHKIVAGMFGVASGSDLLAVFNNYATANGVQAFAVKLAEFLPAATTEERVASLMDNFGFEDDETDPESPGSLAHTYFHDTIDGGANVGNVVYAAVQFLSSETLATDFPAFVPWANLLANKAQLAEVYSETQPSTTLEELALPFSVVIPTDSLLTREDATTLLADVLPATFTLTASAASLTEGSSTTYTVTSSKAVEADTDVVFTLVAGDTTAADQGTDTTNLNDFAAGAFNSVTVTIPAGETTATFSVTATDDGLTELPENFSVEAVVGGQTLTADTVLTDSNVQTFTLTRGEDNLTGTEGDDLFLAPVVQDNIGDAVSTLQNVDVLNGGAGMDTLNATLAIDNAAPTLQGIENINARFIDPLALDLVNSSGIEQVIAHQSADVGTVSNIGDIATLGVKNQNQDAIFTGNTATSQNIIFDTVGASQDIADQVTVDFDTGATTANITTNDSNVEVGTLASVENLSVEASGENRINLTTTLATVMDVTVTGTGTLDLTDAAFTAVETVDGTANEGGVSIIVDDTAVTVDTGSGDDSVEYTAALAATAGVTLGAGDDTFTIAAASVAGSTVDGGDDNDTLAVTNGTFLDADAADIYTNFETLEIGGGQGTYDMENLPGLTAVTAGAALAAAADITNAEAGTTVTANAAASTDLDLGFALTYALMTATGTSDEVSLTLNALDGDDDATAEGVITVTSFTANDIETFNIASNVSDIDPDLENSDYTNTITALDGDAVETVNVSGNANLDITALASTTVKKIDANTMTGGLTVDASASSGVEFIGGSGDDVYTGTAGGDTVAANGGMDTVTLDATFASVDTLILNAGDSELNADLDGHDVINNFGTTAGGGALDVFDVGAFAFTGQQASALANKGALAASAVDGSTLSVTDFFSSGGVDRGVAIGTNGGDTYVFIDANKDGDFVSTDDVVAQVVAVTDLTLANFGF